MGGKRTFVWPVMANGYANTLNKRICASCAIFKKLFQILHIIKVNPMRLSLFLLADQQPILRSHAWQNMSVLGREHLQPK